MNIRSAFHRKCINKQRGLASVEFAVGSLVIFVLMLAAAELGRIYYSYNTLTKSVRNGSRYLSTVALNSASLVDLSGEKTTRTRNLVAYGNPDGNGRHLLEGLASSDINISQFDANGGINQYVEVTAEFDYQPMLSIVPGFSSGGNLDFGFTMNASSTMRVLR